MRVDRRMQKTFNSYFAKTCIIFIPFIASSCDTFSPSCHGKQHANLTRNDAINVLFRHLQKTSSVDFEKYPINQQLKDGCCNVYMPNGTGYAPKNVKYVLNYVYKDFSKERLDKFREIEIAIDKCGTILSNEMGEFEYRQSISLEDFDRFRSRNREAR